MSRTPQKRAYRSSVRESAAAATRERLFEAAERILGDEGVAGLSFQRLAAAADVSVPTVYRNFRSIEELLGAFFLWFRPRVGMGHDTLFSSSLTELTTLPSRNFPAFERNGEVLRALIDSPEANRVRVRAIVDRKGRAAANVHKDAPKWPAARLGELIGAVVILQSPQSWRWLRDTWELDPEAAERTATWAMETLVAAIIAGPAPTRTQPKKKKGKS